MVLYEYRFQSSACLQLGEGIVFLSILFAFTSVKFTFYFTYCKLFPVKIPFGNLCTLLQLYFLFEIFLMC